MLAALARSPEKELSLPEVVVATRCAEVLQVMLPSLLSFPHIAFYIFWRNDVPSQTAEDDAYNIYANRSTRETSHDPGKDEEEKKLGENPAVTGVPLGARLVQTLISLLFKQGFTICGLDEEERTKIDPFGIDIKLIWSGGLQFSETRQSKERKFDSARVAVLRLLLICVTSQLYNPSENIFNYFAFCTTCGAAPYIKNLFFSLMNIVLSYNWKGYVSFSLNTGK